ncbi:MAG: orotidine-5'-phosphate decarboxylase [Pseudomonadota bacterium]
MTTPQSDADPSAGASRIIVALDVPSVAEAEAAAMALRGHVGVFKIGLQLITVGGAELAARLAADGAAVFLDLKFHDIGATVEKAVRSASTLKPAFLTVHAEPQVMEAAVQGRSAGVRVLAVTVLTSLGGDPTEIRDTALRRAEAAARAGCDGVVASPLEAADLRARFGGDLLIVTPGVRPKAAAPLSASDDQRRVATPGDAIRAGADYLVVGRPILSAPSPVSAAQSIAQDIEDALAGGA